MAQADLRCPWQTWDHPLARIAGRSHETEPVSRPPLLRPSATSDHARLARCGCLACARVRCDRCSAGCRFHGRAGDADRGAGDVLPRRAVSPEQPCDGRVGLRRRSRLRGRGRLGRTCVPDAGREASDHAGVQGREGPRRQDQRGGHEDHLRESARFDAAYRSAPGAARPACPGDRRRSAASDDPLPHRADRGATAAGRGVGSVARRDGAPGSGRNRPLPRGGLPPPPASATLARPPSSHPRPRAPACRQNPFGGFRAPARFRRQVHPLPDPRRGPVAATGRSLSASWPSDPGQLFVRVIRSLLGALRRGEDRLKQPREAGL